VVAAVRLVGDRHDYGVMGDVDVRGLDVLQFLGDGLGP
jgi:hypothetical protein